MWILWDISLLFRCPVVFNFLWPHVLQHSSPPCPSLSPGVCSHSCPLSRWYHPAISSSVAPFSSVFPSTRVFATESVLCIRWSKYWCFSINSSNEYSDSAILNLSLNQRRNLDSTKSFYHNKMDVEDVHSSSPASTPKLQLAAEQPWTGECWIPPERDTPHPMAK